MRHRASTSAQKGGPAAACTPPCRAAPCIQLVKFHPLKSHLSYIKAVHKPLVPQLTSGIQAAPQAVPCTAAAHEQHPPCIFFVSKKSHLCHFAPPPAARLHVPQSIPRIITDQPSPLHSAVAACRCIETSVISGLGQKSGKWSPAPLPAPCCCSQRSLCWLAKVSFICLAGAPERVILQVQCLASYVLWGKPS